MYTQWNTDNRRKHLRAVILLLFHSDALGTHKVRKWLKEALVNHNLICVYTSHLSTKSPAKIFPVTDSYQRIVFLAEELPREGKLPKKGMLYQVFLFSTCNLHGTSNQALINAAHPTSYLSTQKDKRLVFILSQWLILTLHIFRNSKREKVAQMPFWGFKTRNKSHLIILPIRTSSYSALVCLKWVLNCISNTPRASMPFPFCLLIWLVNFSGNSPYPRAMHCSSFTALHLFTGICAASLLP